MKKEILAYYGFLATFALIVLHVFSMNYKGKWVEIVAYGIPLLQFFKYYFFWKVIETENLKNYNKFPFQLMLISIVLDLIFMIILNKSNIMLHPEMTEVQYLTIRILVGFFQSLLPFVAIIWFI